MAAYRYGFNGQEKSDEIKGEANSYTAEFWEYDPRLARRWNLDPKPSAGIGQYSAFNNNPIFFKDVLGDSAGPPIFPRHPINNLSDIAYVPYNIIGTAVHGVQSTASKAIDYLNALTSGVPIGSVSQQVTSDYNNIADVVSAPINYTLNTPAKKQWSDAKADLSNPDNYFKSFEQAVVIGATWKFGGNGGSVKSGVSKAATSGEDMVMVLPSFVKTVKANTLKLLHKESTIIKSVDYLKIQKLTDDELIESVMKPTNYDPVTVNTRNGLVVDGNTRIYEIQRRGLDVNVPITPYTPKD